MAFGDLKVAGGDLLEGAGMWGEIEMQAFLGKKWSRFFEGMTLDWRRVPQTGY